jgi:hypothetical protein
MLGSSQAETTSVLSGQIKDLLPMKVERGASRTSRRDFMLLTLLSFRSISEKPSVFQHFRRYLSTGHQYEIEGVLLTKEDVRAIAPEQRTVAHWLLLVDWDLQKQRPYVIIDPYDPQGLLYLNSAEYLVQTRAFAAANVPFIVIARPGTVKPVPTKTPPEFLASSLDQIFADGKPLGKAIYEKGGQNEVSGSENVIASDFSRKTWKEFTDLRKWISRNVPWGEGETVKVNDGNINGLVVMWARELLHYLDLTSPGRRIGQLTPFVQHLQTVLRHNGPAFTIQRLKISLFCLYSYVGGNPVKDTSELGQRVRLRNGLPVFLGTGPRSSIRANNAGTIRLWASLLNIYKVMWGLHGQSPLETITAPPYIGDIGDFASFCQGEDSFFERWQAAAGGKALPGWKYRSSYGYLITSAGANSSLAMTSLYWDALAWSNSIRNLPLEWYTLWGDFKLSALIRVLMSEAEVWNDARLEYDTDAIKPLKLLKPLLFDEETKTWGLNPEIWKSIRRVMTIDEDGEFDLIWRASPAQISEVRKLLLDWQAQRKDLGNNRQYYLDTLKDLPDIQIERWIEVFRKVGQYPTRMSYHKPLVGRLHSIPESAGKVRVVAIGDYFSQVALKPLHEYLFSLLRLNPNDATFGQQEAVDLFASAGYKEIFSYDLKSATDLIPAQLYVEVLIPLIGRKGADLWLDLMKSREWLSPKDVRKQKEFVRYTRGQPMGLLSSWASLAVVHHGLVQFAAKQTGWKGWFPHYLVLGDDIVIADAAVAEAYLNVCNDFGIKVGLAKSLISKNGLMNFASQTLLDNKNLSPISLGEELVALNWDRRIELAKRIVHRYDGEEPRANGFLRRVLTANQWQALQGELTGMRKRDQTRFIEFILRNPFVGTDDFHIDRVIDWLALLVPTINTANSLKAELGEAIRAELFSFVKNVHQAKVDDLNACIGAASRLAGGGPNNDWELPHYWNYLQQAVSAKFENISRDMQAVGLSIKKVEPGYLPSLEAILGWYLTLEAVPPLSNRFGQDPRYNVFSVLKELKLRETLGKPKLVGKVGSMDLPAPKAPKDSLRAPLQPILLAVARAFGVKLPLYEIKLSRPKASFFATLMASIEDFEVSRIKSTASPNRNEVALVPVEVGLPPMVVQVFNELGSLET